MDLEKRKKSLKAFHDRNPGYNARHTKKWRDANPDKVEAYAQNGAKVYERRRRLGRYGISEEEYARLLASQQGKCAICGVRSEDCVKGLSIDHCHLTSIVRGLLCHRCNTAIGLMRHDESVLSRAISYLKRRHPSC